MVSALASSLGGHWAGLTPRAAQGRSRAVVSAPASSLSGHLAGLTPRAAQGRSRAVVSAPASSLGGHRAGLTQRSGRGWPWPREDRGHRPAFPGWSRAHPLRSTASPRQGPGRTRANTEQAASSPRGHRAQGTGLADPGRREETQADRQPHWTVRAGVTSISISLHTHVAGLHSGPIIIRDRREMRRMFLTKRSQEQLCPSVMAR